MSQKEQKSPTEQRSSLVPAHGVLCVQYHSHNHSNSSVASSARSCIVLPQAPATHPPDRVWSVGFQFFLFTDRPEADLDESRG